MSTCMARSKPKAESPKEPEIPATVFFRLDEPTRAALAAFIKTQVIQPTVPAISFQALHDFLAKHGHWPPKKDT